MVHTLTLQVPEELYMPLIQTATQAKQNPEELIVRWLMTAFRQFQNDPLEKFIGAFASNVSDWADQHDKYIGQTLAEELNNLKQLGN